MAPQQRSPGFARAGLLTIAAAALGCGSAGQAIAGNGANFIVYDHHNEDKGTTEVLVFNDIACTADDGVRYIAQLIEIEHALTDQWVAALYLESHKEHGEDGQFDGVRLESRYRLFDDGTPFKPVVYWALSFLADLAIAAKA